MNKPSAKWARRYSRKHRKLIAVQTLRQARTLRGPQPKSRAVKRGQA
jgi:hypothetical protein